MLVWSGHGYLVAVITFGICLLMNFALDAQYGKGFYSSHLWAVGTALMIGGFLSMVAGLLLKARTDREVIDVETGERMVLHQSEHSFFFLPMHWAGIVIALIGVGIAIYDAVV